MNKMKNLIEALDESIKELRSQGPLLDLSTKGILLKALLELQATLEALQISWLASRKGAATVTP